MGRERNVARRDGRHRRSRHRRRAWWLWSVVLVGIVLAGAILYAALARSGPDARRGQRRGPDFAATDAASGNGSAAPGDARAARAPPRPSLRPLPAEKATRPGLWSVPVSAATDRVSASASRSRKAWQSGMKGRYDPAYPEGTTVGYAEMRVSGWPRLNHEEYVIPAGAKHQKRWDYGRATLPDGRILLGSALSCQSGNENFSPWSFLQVSGRAPGGTKTIPLLKPSLCASAASFEGDRWASAELVLERPLTETCTMRFSIRVKRVAGDPLLYVLVTADLQGGRVETLHLHGYPGYAHPCIYGLRPRYPRHAKFLERQRWVWIAGRDWNMHDRNEPHEVEVAPADPGGAFWYNRLNCETGGMCAVFLPEDVERVAASGTYGVGITLRLKRPIIRLALREWKDWRGWPLVRADFETGLPKAVDRLRSMSFAWPIDDLLGAARRGEVETLLAARALRADDREALGDALVAYDAARRALREEPVRDTESRFAAERKVILLKARLEDATAPLVAEFVRRGGVFGSDVP